MRTYILVLVLSLAAPVLQADPSSPTHSHSVSIDGSSGGSSFGGPGNGGPPPAIGGGSFSAAPPPPPPPPPPVYSPKIIKGNGVGVESKVKKLGVPGESEPERGVRNVSGIYSDGESAVTGEVPSRRGPRTLAPTGTTDTSTANSPAGF